MVYEGVGEVAGRTKVEVVTRETAESTIRWCDAQDDWDTPNERVYLQTILALYTDNERLVEALEAVKDALDSGEHVCNWCGLYGVHEPKCIAVKVNTALAKHKEGFGNE